MDDKSNNQINISKTKFLIRRIINKILLNMDIVNHAIKKKSKDPFFKIAIPKANRILIQFMKNNVKFQFLKKLNF